MKTCQLVLAFAAAAATISTGNANSLRNQVLSQLEDDPAKMPSMKRLEFELTKYKETLKAKGVDEKSLKAVDKVIQNVEEAEDEKKKEGKSFNFGETKDKVVQVYKSVISMREAIEKGEQRNALAGALSVGTAICAIIPGGQGVAAVLTFLRGLVGTTEEPGRPGLTIEDIKAVVQTVVQDQSSRSAAATILSTCSGNIINIQQEMKLFESRLSRTYTTPQEIASARANIDKFVGRMPTFIDQAQLTWSQIQNHVQQEVLVKEGQMCYDTCHLTTTPLNLWFENPTNPNLSTLNQPEWDPCPFPGIFFCEDDKYAAPQYKMCYWHRTREIWQPIGENALHPKIEVDEACKSRVNRASQCQEEYNNAKRQHETLLGALQCAREQTLALQILLFKAMVAVDRYKLGDIAITDLPSDLRDEQLRLSSQIYYMAMWNKETLNVYVKDGVEYQCDKPKEWVHLAGYKDGRLMDPPCTTDEYCRLIRKSFRNGENTGSKYCDDSFKCSLVNPSQTKRPFDFKGPTYQYKRIFGAKWDTKFEKDLPNFV